MKILLTGATGFLGSRTLEKLMEDSSIDSVVAAGRTIRKSHEISHPKIKYVLGNLSDKNYVDKITNGIDTIIHAAALSSPWGKETEFITANVESIQNLITSGQEKNIKRFIYISTPSLYFNGKDRTNIKESDFLPKKFINAYAKTKRDAEILLEDSSLPFVILRPRALIGRGDTIIMPRLIRACDEGKLKIIGKGNNLADLTAVANVAHAIELAIHCNQKALNQTYNITNDEPINLWHSINFVLEQIGKKKLPNKKIPYWLVKSVASFLELKSKITNYKEPALTKYGVATLAKTTTLNIDKAKNSLGYQPQQNTHDAIIEFAKWYLENEEN